MKHEDEPGEGIPEGSQAFSFEIGNQEFNFTSYRISDQKPTGAQIAELVGAHPISDFVVLQHLKTGELESLRPTETIDLAEAGIERFFVIEGSELFRFEVEGLSMEWPITSILPAHVKFLGKIPAGSGLLLDRGGPSEHVDDDEPINLRRDGVERIRILKGKNTVTVYYADAPFELERREYTTEELIARFGVPAGYLLDLVRKNGEFKELKPGEKIKAKEGLEFASHPPRGQSS
jgi:hypothetical protein